MPKLHSDSIFLPKVGTAAASSLHDPFHSDCLTCMACDQLDIFFFCARYRYANNKKAKALANRYHSLPLLNTKPDYFLAPLAAVFLK